MTYTIKILEMEGKFNNTTSNWTTDSNTFESFTVDNRKAMVDLWEARYINLRFILYKLNVYFLPVLICVGKSVVRTFD